MTTLDIQPSRRAIAHGVALPVAVYSATVFLSAALLFFLEPMFSKMVLPLLGGSSAVWSVAMVVFQGLLLAGYLYAHLLTRFLQPRTAAMVHLATLAIAMIFLPIAVRGQFDVPPVNGVSLWLIGVFVGSVGLPCFALSANAPLLQAWFARCDQGNGNRAYFLYRASNLGSFAILLSYPILIEPNIGLVAQSRLWSVGYALLVLAVAACGTFVLRLPRMNDMIATRASAVRWSDRFRWTALAFVPSGLLVAVTAYIATDVASAPFLWIIPLALYLLTFVLLFTDRPAISQKVLLAIQPVTVALLVISFLWTAKLPWGVSFLIHLTAFFFAAMICHGQLYARRPDASQLTQFYVWMSLGGVLGGIFAALLAPQLFNTVIEYPLLVFAALLARPDIWKTARADWIKESAVLLAGAIVVAMAFLFTGKNLALYTVSVMAFAALLAVVGKSPARFLPLAAILLAVTNFYDPSQDTVYRGRSFYSTYKAVDLSGGKFRVLFQGVTAHGGERLRDDNGAVVTARPDPLTYYYRGGPYDTAIQAIRHRAGGTLNHVALIGLGMGALSCNATPGEGWTFYELDPLSVTIAHNTNLFHSVSRCAPAVPTIIGDGRLTLRAAKPDIDLLILDMFSSDSVPTHMLTREAFALYKARLSPHGAITINVSNKNLKLSNIVAASAAANGMVTAVKRDNVPPDTFRTLHLRAEIAVVARSAADMAALKLGPDWHIVRPDATTRIWTDDYSAILDAIFAKMRE
jgi:hypothetical protein